jgi:acetolactate synthase-1/2/3 large subunit
MPTVAEALVDQLASAGVDTVFGLPGGEVVEILDALRRRNLRFVFVHNESSAVFMADAMARLTGKPGVALTTLGPGSTNAVAGVAHAYLDRSPVLVITAQKPDSLLPDYTHQVIDQLALFTPITKGAFKLTAQNAREVIGHSLALAQSDRPGPVLLQISNEEASLPLPNAGTQSPPRTRSDSKISDEAMADRIARARDLIASARKPVVVVGLGVEPERPYDSLRAFAEAVHAPVIVLPKAKGVLADDHPLSAGVIGLMRTDPAYEILEEADCLVAVGLDVVELVKPWAHPAPLIWIAPWANENPVVPAAVELVGPMAPTLQRLTCTRSSVDSKWGESRVAAFHDKLASRTYPTPAAGRMSPQQVLSVLRSELPRDMLLAVDVGSHKIHSSLDWPTFTPNRFLLSNGLSCMGYGLPAAIGASFVLNAPTVCLTGDAGMAMVMGELAVLVQWQLPVLVVVLNDSAFDLIRSHQVRVGKPVFGTEFPSPNFTQVAAAYGVNAARVQNDEEFANALRTGLSLGKPMLIEVMLDPTNYPTTPKQMPVAL